MATVYEAGLTTSKCDAKSGLWTSLCWTSPAGKPYVATCNNSNAMPVPISVKKLQQKTCNKDFNSEECSFKGICMNRKCVCFEGYASC